MIIADNEKGTILMMKCTIERLTLYLFKQWPWMVSTRTKKGLFEIFLNNEYIRDGKNIKKYNLPI